MRSRSGTGCGRSSSIPTARRGTPGFLSGSIFSQSAASTRLKIDPCWRNARRPRLWALATTFRPPEAISWRPGSARQGTWSAGSPEVRFGLRGIERDAKTRKRASDGAADGIVDRSNTQAPENAFEGRGDAVRELLVVEKRAAPGRPSDAVDPELAAASQVDRFLDSLPVAQAHRRRMKSVDPNRCDALGLARGKKERLVDGHVEGPGASLVDEEPEPQFRAADREACARGSAKRPPPRK